MGGQSIFGLLDAHSIRWYIFTTENNEIFFALLYEPEAASIDQIEISFDREQDLDNRNPISSGRPVSGRPALLVLESKNLQAGERFFLRLSNNNPDPIYYCLASKDTPKSLEWTCQ